MKKELYEMTDFWDVFTDDELCTYTMLTLTCPEIGEITISIPDFGHSVTVSTMLKENVTVDNLDKLYEDAKEIELDKTLKFSRILSLILCRIRDDIRMTIYNVDDTITLYSVINKIKEEYQNTLDRFLSFTMNIGGRLTDDQIEIIERRPHPREKRFTNIYLSRNCSNIKFICVEKIKDDYTPYIITPTDTSMYTHYYMEKIKKDIEELNTTRMFITNPKIKESVEKAIYEEFYKDMTTKYYKQEKRKYDDEREKIKKYGETTVPVNILIGVLHNQESLKRGSEEIERLEYELNVWTKQQEDSSVLPFVKDRINELRKRIQDKKEEMKEQEASINRLARKYQVID